MRAPFSHKTNMKNQAATTKSNLTTTHSSALARESTKDSVGSKRRHTAFVCWTTTGKRARKSVLFLVLVLVCSSWVRSAKAQCEDLPIAPVQRLDGFTQDEVVVGYLYPDCRFVEDPNGAVTLDPQGQEGNPFFQIGSYYLEAPDNTIDLYRQAYPWADFIQNGDPTGFGQYRVEGCGPTACGGGGACAGEIVVDQPIGNGLVDGSDSPVVFLTTNIGEAAV